MYLLVALTCKLAAPRPVAALGSPVFSLGQAALARRGAARYCDTCTAGHVLYVTFYGASAGKVP